MNKYKHSTLFRISSLDRLVFEVRFVVLYYVTVMFDFVRTITFRVFSSINIVGEDSISSSLIIFALENSGIYVGALNSSKMPSDIE